MEWEFSVLDWIQKLHTPLGDVLMPFFSRLGDKGLLWIVFAAVLLLIPKCRKTGFVVAAALVVELIVCNGILKPVVARVRPYDVNTAIALMIAEPTDYSFPSGHTAAAFAVVSGLLCTGSRLWIPAGLAAVLIAFSRMYLYVHYPTDILGGLLIGIAAGAAGAVIVRMVLKRKGQRG